MSISIGQVVAEAISSALDRCGAMIVVVGDGWLTETNSLGQFRLNDPNDVVVQEIEMALERGLVVIPALVEGARMPADYELPQKIRDLKRRSGCR